MRFKLCHAKPNQPETTVDIESVDQLRELYEREKRFGLMVTFGKEPQIVIVDDWLD